MNKSEHSFISIVDDGDKLTVTQTDDHTEVANVLAFALFQDNDAFDLITGLFELLDGKDFKHKEFYDNSPENIDLEQYNIFKVEENYKNDIIVDIYGGFDDFVGIFKTIFSSDKSHEIIFRTALEAAKEFRLDNK